MRALDQPRNIGHHEAAEAGQLRHSQIRFESGKRVIRDLRPRRRNARDQRRFAGVRKAHQPHVRQQLQLQPQPPFLSRTPRFVLRRRLVRGSGEARVAASTAPAARHQKPLAFVREIVKLLARRFVVDHRADRHFDFYRLRLRRRCGCCLRRAGRARPCARG